MIVLEVKEEMVVYEFCVYQVVSCYFFDGWFDLFLSFGWDVLDIVICELFFLWMLRWMFLLENEDEKSSRGIFYGSMYYVMMFVDVLFYFFFLWWFFVFL